MDKSKAVDHYLEEIGECRKDFGQARKEMEMLGFEPDEINMIIRHIDNELISYELDKSDRRTGREFFWVGLVLFAAGVFFTIGTYTGFIDLGNVWILNYGPIIAGLGLMAGFRPKDGDFGF